MAFAMILALLMVCVLNTVLIVVMTRIRKGGVAAEETDDERRE